MEQRTVADLPTLVRVDGYATDARPRSAHKVSDTRKLPHSGQIEGILKMTSPLQASAEKAGTLISSSCFKIPSFQREYSWKNDKVSDLWEDLSSSVNSENYFLGLIILTEKKSGKKEINNVIDGQQRLVTLSLLAKAMSNKARSLDQMMIADQIDSTFLRYMNFNTQKRHPRISFTDQSDDEIYKAILSSDSQTVTGLPKGAASSQMKKSFDRLSKDLNEFLDSNPDDYLGRLTEFLTSRLYFAVFVHPDDSAAFRIFEVINTRGQELTPADLLKNYVLGEAHGERQEKKFYRDWQYISDEIKEVTSGSAGTPFVQYIRHVIISKYGHIAGRDLYDVLSKRKRDKKYDLHASKLISLLKTKLPLYKQMIDPNPNGDVEDRRLEIFSAFKSLNVSSVRPILLALSELDDGIKGMEYLLRIVVRLMVVESIGTGRIESKFGEAAEILAESGDWNKLPQCLSEIDPNRDRFVDRLKERSITKRTLTFIRRSVLQGTRTPEEEGHLHWIMPRDRSWGGVKSGEANLVTSLGNSFLSKAPTLPKDASKSWDDFKDNLSDFALDDEITNPLKHCVTWDTKAIEMMGEMMAEKAAEVWY